MTEPSITAALSAQKALPLFTCGDGATGLKVLAALHAGGIRIVEFTNRTPAALDVFRDLMAAAAEQFPDMTLGAGTIIDARQAINPGTLMPSPLRHHGRAVSLRPSAATHRPPRGRRAARLLARWHTPHVDGQP